MDELIEGRDGLVRAVHIKTANGRPSRTISKLCPLEVCSTETQADEGVDKQVSEGPTSDTMEICPSRAK